MADAPAPPGLISSHLSYAKGAAVEAIGSATGSKEWSDSGVEQKDSAVEDMRAAAQSNEDAARPNQPVAGSIEQKLGSAVGCEGMVEDGKKRDANEREGGYGGQEELHDKHASTAGDH